MPSSKLALLLVVAIALNSTNGSPMDDALKSVHCELKGYKFTVKVVGCQPRAVEINICVGTCLSFSTPSGPAYSQAARCDCCRVVAKKEVQVGLHCKDPNNSANLRKKYHTIKSATDCACVKC